MDLTWILYKLTGSDTVHRMIVSQIIRNIRSLDDCDKILGDWTCDYVEAVGFYPVSDEEFEKLPDNTVFFHC